MIRSRNVNLSHHVNNELNIVYNVTFYAVVQYALVLVVNMCS